MDLVDELRLRSFAPGSPFSRAADEIKRLRQENEDWREVTREYANELDRLNDERPAYPGAWVAEIDQLRREVAGLEQRLAYQRDTILDLYAQRNRVREILEQV